MQTQGTLTKNPRHLPFADWLKAIGISLIVYGHVAAATTVTWTPPVYPKQIGVAFFVFVTGFTLARESRDRIRVLFNRYFEIFFFGLVFALMMAAVGAIVWSDPNESNFLPLLLGLNVLVNDFPANPTTWYIGTYLHLLLVWAFVLSTLRIPSWMLALVCAIEIPLRAVLIETQGRYVAYMLVSNWLTVFMFGLAYGRKELQLHKRSAGRSAFLALIVIAGWPMLMSFTSWRLTFPFMTLEGLPSLHISTLLVSLAVSLVYVGYTLAAYAVTAHLPASALVRFIARNTTIVFVVHMPLYYLLEFWLRPLVPTYGVRVTVEFVACLFGLALVSEGIRQIVRPTVLRERIAERFAPWLGSPSNSRI